MMPSSWVKSAFEADLRAGAGGSNTRSPPSPPSVVAWRLVASCASPTCGLPFSYEGDALAFGLMLKSIIDHGWYLTNPHLSAPGVLQLPRLPIPRHRSPAGLEGHVVVHVGLGADLQRLLPARLSADSRCRRSRSCGIFASGTRPRSRSACSTRSCRAACLKGEKPLPSSICSTRVAARDPRRALEVCGERTAPRCRVVGVGGGWSWRARRRRGRRPGAMIACASWAALGICVLTAGTGLYYAFFSGVLITRRRGSWASVRRRTARQRAPRVMVVLTAVLIVAGLGLCPGHSDASASQPAPGFEQ